MIKALDIRNAIIKKIEDNFTVKILAGCSDCTGCISCNNCISCMSCIADDIEVPAFFVKVELLSYEAESKIRNLERHEITICYRPQDLKNVAEKVVIQDKLVEIFNSNIQVKNRVFDLTNMKLKYRQGVLLFNFVISFQQNKESNTEHGAKMQEIIIK